MLSPCFIIVLWRTIAVCVNDMVITNYSFQTLNNPSKQFVDEVQTALAHYNQSVTGPVKTQKLAVSVTNINGNMLGTMYGWMQWGWLYIEMAWVDESVRKQGIGHHLLRLLEDAALEHGIDRAYLNTGSFQALEFYLKNGYSIYAEREITADDGREYIDYSLRKPSLRAYRTTDS